MTSNSGELVMSAGSISGYKSFGDVFRPAQVIVLNNSPVTLYYVQGDVTTQPGTAIFVPPNAYVPLPYTQNGSRFTLFWDNGTALPSTYTVKIWWSDTPLPMPFALLTQPVSGNLTVSFPAAQSVNANITNSNLAVAFVAAQPVDANITNSAVSVTFPSAQEIQWTTNGPVVVQNTTGSPVYNLAANGAYDVLLALAEYGSNTSPTQDQSITIITSGNYVKTVNMAGSWTVTATSTGVTLSGTVYLTLGTVRIAQLGTYNITTGGRAETANWSFVGSFQNGVSNTGFSLEFVSNLAPASVAFSNSTGYGVGSVSTPPQKVSVIG